MLHNKTMFGLERTPKKCSAAIHPNAIFPNIIEPVLYLSKEKLDFSEMAHCWAQNSFLNISERKQENQKKLELNSFIGLQKL